MFRAERDKQYDEILEECQEFIQEVNHNIDKKKTTQEEVEEMEEVLDGLRRWLARVREIDWVEKPVTNRVAKLLESCQDLMDKFTSFPIQEKETLEICIPNNISLSRTFKELLCNGYYIYSIAYFIISNMNEQNNTDRSYTIKVKLSQKNIVFTI